MLQLNGEDTPEDPRDLVRHVAQAKHGDAAVLQRPRHVAHAQHGDAAVLQRPGAATPPRVRLDVNPAGSQNLSGSFSYMGRKASCR